MGNRSIRFILAATAVWIAILVLPAAAHHHHRLSVRHSDAPLTDQLDVFVRRREVIAVQGSYAAKVRSFRIASDEDVLWIGTRGRVGVAVTSKRLLAITTQAANWREFKFRVHESLPEAVLLGDRVALVVTSHHAIGLTGSVGKLVVQELGAYEDVVDALIGNNVAAVMTDRRVLGLSASAGGFFEERVSAHEDFEYGSARSNSVTIGTQRRLLVFSGTFGTWDSKRLSLNH